jgi:hypothetical protein
MSGDFGKKRTKSDLPIIRPKANYFAFKIEIYKFIKKIDKNFKENLKSNIYFAFKMIFLWDELFVTRESNNFQLET